MALPRISSGLIDQPAGGNDAGDAPRGRLIMIAGPAGRGPTRPQLITNAQTAYDVYGSDGPLADDVALALRGAELGSATEDQNQVGQVLALRTPTGTPASLTVQSGGTDVMTLETATGGADADEWRFDPGENSVTITSPDGTEATFNYDAAGGENDITTPSELARAIMDSTDNRLEVEVHRGEAHFEMSVSQHSNFSSNDISFDTSGDDTTLDFTDASNADVAALTNGGNTAIGDDTDYYDSGSEPVHNYIVPEDQDAARFYAVTAGEVTALPSGSEEQTLSKLADSSRVGIGTDSILNLHTADSGGSAIPLTEVGKRDGTVSSEAFYRVRGQYAGQLDSTQTSTTSDSTYADFDAKVAADEDPSGDTGSGSASSTMSYDSTTLNSGDKVLIFGGHTDASGDLIDGLYSVKADDSGDLYLNRYRTGQTLSSNGHAVEVASGSNSGIKVYDVGTNEISDAEVIEFSFDAPHGIADKDGSDAGSLALSYAQWVEGDSTLNATSTAAKNLSVNRLVPDDYDKFEDTDEGPLKVMIAPVTDPQDAEEFDGEYKTSWSEGEATIDLDAAEIPYDEAIVYVSYDSCIFDLREEDNQSDLTSSGPLQYTVEGQTLVFGRQLDHEMVVRPLRVTQYRRGSDIEIRRTAGGGNKFVFHGTGNQPGAAGGPIEDIETLLGFDYKYEPSFPPSDSEKNLSGSTSGVNADPQVRAQALRDALRSYGNIDHDMLVASGLHVDEMQGAKDPVTGAVTNEPVGVLDIIDDHQARQSETGASPVAFTSVKPMEPSTTTGMYTDAQKLDRVEELTETPPAGEENAASIIQSESRPEVFIFDAPMRISVGGRSVETSSPALWAGIRSTLGNQTTLHRVDLSAIGEAVYKYDVGGAGLPGRLDSGRINTWDPRRGATRLAGERTAAGFILNEETGRLEPSGWQSGIALLAAKTFQQDAEDQLRVLTGQAMPSGGAEVLRGTIETMIQGVVERTSGVRRILMEPQQDIQIRAEENNSLGIYITAELVVNGEISRIDLQVGAVTEPQLNSEDGGNPIPTAQ